MLEERYAVDVSKDLNQKYYDEGWGHLAEKALGIKPEDVESSARTVARYAVLEISKLKKAIENELDEHLNVIEQYERNGPQWTSPQGNEYESTLDIINRSEERVEVIREILRDV